MFYNIEKKIKLVAWINFIIYAAISGIIFIIGIVIASDEESWLLFFVGCIISGIIFTIGAVISFFAYGFGELIEVARSIDRKVDSKTGLAQETSYFGKLSGNDGPLFKDESSSKPNRPAGSWVCERCKNVNASYVGTCKCGASKPL